MHSARSLKKIAAMSCDERHELAASKTNALVSEVLGQLRTIANNNPVLRSQVLSSQIPLSYAGTAFNHFRAGLAHYEIMRACRLWENVDLDGYSLPTIRALCEHPEMERKVKALGLENYPNEPTEAMTYSLKAHVCFRRAMCVSGLIAESEILTRARNLRHLLAHAIERTDREKSVPVPNAKNNDAVTLTRLAMLACDQFYRSINNCGFAWSDAHAIHKKHAQALWHGVTISIIE